MFCLINSVRFSTNQTPILLDLESWNLELVLFLDLKPRKPTEIHFDTPKPFGRISSKRWRQRKMRCVSSDGPSEEKTHETSSLKLMRQSQFLRIFFCQQKKHRKFLKGEVFGDGKVGLLGWSDGWIDSVYRCLCCNSILWLFVDLKKNWRFWK